MNRFGARQELWTLLKIGQHAPHRLRGLRDERGGAHAALIRLLGVRFAVVGGDHRPALQRLPFNRGVPAAHRLCIDTVADTAREIDLEVHKIIDEATVQVRELLLARRPVLEAVALRLIEKEVMDGAELRQLLERTLPVPRLVPASEALAATSPAVTTPNGDVREAAGPM